MAAPGGQFAFSTPIGPVNSTVTTGGTAVVVFAAGTIPHVADIINPATASSILYVDIVTTALAGQATSIPLAAGQSYRVSQPINTAVTAVASDSGHAFVAVAY